MFYVFDRMCDSCKKSRQLYFKLVEDEEDPDDFDEDMPESWASEYPACSAEWLVVSSDELNTNKSDAACEKHNFRATEDEVFCWDCHLEGKNVN